jgi:hypothetical protein
VTKNIHDGDGCHKLSEDSGVDFNRHRLSAGVALARIVAFTSLNRSIRNQEGNISWPVESYRIHLSQTRLLPDLPLCRMTQAMSTASITMWTSSGSCRTWTKGQMILLQPSLPRPKRGALALEVEAATANEDLTGDVIGER